MRLLIVLVLVVAGVAVLVTFSPSFRQRVDAILPPEAPQGQAAASSGARQAPRASRPAPPRETAEQVAPGPQRPAEPQEPPVQPTAPSPGPEAERPRPTQPAPRLELPAPLGTVSFGMSPEQVKRLFPAAWAREAADELTLVHYPLSDRSQAYRFSFSGGGLHLVEVVFTPRRGVALKELYERYRQALAERYGGLPTVRRTSWSDGRVTARIRSERNPDQVVISFSCPAGRR